MVHTTTESLDQQDLARAAEAFHRDGYCVWRRFFNAGQMHELMRQIDRYVREVLPGLPPERAYYEDKNDPRSLFRLEVMQDDPWFDQLRRSEQLTTLARALLKDDLNPQGVEVFGKAPRIGKVTPPHQDGNYWKLVPNEGLTMWLALDAVDEANGCLRYVPGSHRKPMRSHAASNTFGFSLGITDFGSSDQQMEVAICAEPGDLIVHHGLTIHRADANRSDRLRRALGFVYYAARAKPDRAAVEAHLKTVHEKWAKEKRL